MPAIPGAGTQPPPAARPPWGDCTKLWILCQKCPPRNEGGIIAQNLKFRGSGAMEPRRACEARLHSPRAHSPPRAVRRAGAVGSAIHRRAERRAVRACENGGAKARAVARTPPRDEGA